MPSAQQFRDPETYQKVRQQAKYIFKLTRRLPKEETYALTDQIRRSSRAVGALIAEAWARRRYEAAFVNKLNQALAEAMETQSWLDAAYDCDYIDADTHDPRYGVATHRGNTQPYDPAVRPLLSLTALTYSHPPLTIYYPQRNSEPTTLNA
ncbi:MAG: four helix bundle protein [Bacteroidetes bacterium SW_9_63_38]|nr:MAG: four helix bundle protein [Bacteroidetes bacterium SW_9_63_38]